MMDMEETLPSYAALSYYEGDDVYPVTRITAGAVGSPGRRTFVLQAFFGAEPFSWIIEKDQAMALSRAIPELLGEVQEEFPELGDPLVAAAPNLNLTEPLQPLFRVGSIGVGYDRLHDLVIFTLVDADLMDGGEEEEELMEEEESDPPEHQIYTTRRPGETAGRTGRQGGGSRPSPVPALQRAHGRLRALLPPRQHPDSTAGERLSTSDGEPTTQRLHRAVGK